MADFFRHGWHLVLTDHELVTLLAIIDRTGYIRRVERSRELHDMGVDLKEAVRYTTYGLSGEAYNSIHMLARFGLINLIDPMPDRRNPTPRSPNPSPSPETTRKPTPTAERLIYPPTTDRIQQFRPALGTVLANLAI